MNLDHSDVVPLYKQLKNIILRDIQQGVYQQGSKIPPELELSKIYNVSRITVRGALEELTEDNVLVRQQGRGTFVKNTKFKREISGIKSFSEICAENGCKAGAKTTVLKKSKATADDIKLLEVDEKSSVVVLERVRLANFLPVSYEVSHFPSEFDFLLKENFEDCSLFKILDENYNISLTQTHKILEITYATKKIAKHLQIAPGYPLLLVTCVSTNAANKKIHLSYQYIVGDKFKFII